MNIIIPFRTATGRVIHANSILQQKRIYHAHFFDTFKFMQHLEQEGFPRDTSEAIMNAVALVIDESVSEIGQTLVTHQEFEKVCYLNRADFNKLATEITMLEHNDFALLKQDMIRLRAEMEKLNQRIAEDLARVQSNVRLEQSLVKGS